MAIHGDIGIIEGSPGLFIACPAYEVFYRGLFPIHEDADTVDFGCNPGQPYEREIENGKRQPYLP